MSDLIPLALFPNTEEGQKVAVSFTGTSVKLFAASLAQNWAKPLKGRDFLVFVKNGENLISDVG